MNPTQDVNNYRPDIDGLRAVAVMAVVLHHLSPSWIPGGFVGVDVFFVISGYLITKIIHREIKEGSFSFAKFYERRIRRLFPALFAVLAFVLVAGWFILLPSDYMATLRAAMGTLTFSANILFWRDLAEGYFAADAKLNPLLHMWSLGVEEQFYLIFPIILLAINKHAKRWLVPLLIAGFLLSLGLSVALTPIKPVASFFLLPTRAWEMLAGALLAVVALPQLHGSGRRECTSIAALLCIAVPVFAYSLDTPFPGYAALLPAAGTILLIWLGRGADTTVSRLLKIRPVVYIGLISYSLYLWHWPVIVFAKFLNGMDSIRTLIPLILLSSLGMAALSHRFIELRFRRGRPTSSVRPTLAYGVSLSAALFVFAGVGYASSGNSIRYSDGVVKTDAVRKSKVPYKHCESRMELDISSFCVIGEPGVDPEILLWGDSHMLAWAPGMDAALKALKKSAYLAVNSACPPLIGVHQSTDPLCKSQNDNVASQIHDWSKAMPGGMVVLSGFWKKYFNESNLILSSNSIGGGNFMVAQHGIHDTVDFLKSREIAVVILGGVPTYRKDVPYLVASNRTTLETLSLAELHSYREHQVLSGIEGHVDTASWFCSPECIVESDGDLIYRDSNHLSIHGALYFEEKLKSVLSRTLSEERQ